MGVGVSHLGIVWMTMGLLIYLTFAVPCMQKSVGFYSWFPPPPQRFILKGLKYQLQVFLIGRNNANGENSHFRYKQRTQLLHHRPIKICFTAAKQVFGSPTSLLLPWVYEARGGGVLQNPWFFFKWPYSGKQVTFGQNHLISGKRLRKYLARGF